MRAEIDATGMMSLIPETQTESYALKQWWDGLGTITGGNGSGIHAAYDELGLAPFTKRIEG